MRAHPSYTQTARLPKPNQYVLQLQNEYSNYAFLEERAPSYKGLWRANAFDKQESSFLDLEIGTGNGFHFGHRAEKHPERLLLGMELKYKPLVQTIRRAVRAGCQNAKVIRYHAGFLQNLFAENELNTIYIHFPDPWSRHKQSKHRLLNREFLDIMLNCQKGGEIVEFKTDNKIYFEWARGNIYASKYIVDFETEDLHQSAIRESNFVTHFESIFLRQQLPIYCMRLRNPKI